MTVYGYKTVTAKLFAAYVHTSDGCSKFDFELAYSRKEAFSMVARRNAGSKIVKFFDELGMPADMLEQARDWRYSGAKHEVNHFADYGEMSVYY